jgi:hypothetical protein
MDAGGQKFTLGQPPAGAAGGLRNNTRTWRPMTPRG